MKKRRKEKKNQNEELHDRLIQWGDTAMLTSGILLLALCVLKFLWFLEWI